MLPVFAGEDIVRQILNTIFFVRPRTKEFMLGYPIFLLFIAYLGNRWTAQWRWLFLAFAMVGLVSVMNTFCHVHAPLLLSILRAANGYILGIAIGFVYIITIHMLAKLWKFIAF